MSPYHIYQPTNEPFHQVSPFMTVQFKSMKLTTFLTWIFSSFFFCKKNQSGSSYFTLYLYSCGQRGDMLRLVCKRKPKLSSFLIQEEVEVRPLSCSIFYGKYKRDRSSSSSSSSSRFVHHLQGNNIWLCPFWIDALRSSPHKITRFQCISLVLHWRFSVSRIVIRHYLVTGFGKTMKLMELNPMDGRMDG